MPVKKPTPVSVPVVPVVPVQSVEVPVETKKAVAPKKKQTDDKKLDTKPVVPQEPVAQTTEPSDDKDENTNGETLLASLTEKISGLASQVKLIQTALKQLGKEFDKQKKIIDKVQKKREKAKKSPSGFAKPCKISDELCDFIGVAKGTEQSRTDITRYINSYVKEHNLNNPQNRREFFPDKKLKAVLNVKDGEKVTYFILQRLIAHHFPPSMSKLAAAAAAKA
jgi:chromatin remodeling complex protein RSC6